MTLDRATIGSTYRIRFINCGAEERQHLYTLGFLNGANVTCVMCAPSGDPIAFSIQGVIIALRKKLLHTIHAESKAGITHGR